MNDFHPSWASDLIKLIEIKPVFCFSFFKKMLQEINNIKANLKATSCDIKAEVFVNELVLNGIPQEDILFKAKSAFKRQFEREVEDLSFVEDDYNGTKIVVEINREGFYDYIPEGVTHFDTDKKAFKSSSEITDEIKFKRFQEKAARDFFQPFENEFYSANVSLENKESGSVNQFDSELNKQLFFKTYGYLPEFDDVQIAKLLFFLPLAYKLRGQDRMIEFILNNLLQFPVKVDLKNVSASYKNEFQGKLSESMLGVNFVLGDSVKIGETCLQITVSELNSSDTVDFFQGGSLFNIIEKVIGFLMPISYKFEIIYHFREQDECLNLQGNEKSCYLGYNSVI